jgi:urease subunit gamma/beta
MHLSPREIEKLMLHQACSLAQKRYARGLPLNVTESIALISGQILEYIREGRSVAELMDLGKQFLGLHDVMPGVADMMHEVQVEGTFPDGTKLVTVHSPICREWGDESLTLYGSGLTRKNKPSVSDIQITPGEVCVGNGEIELNAGRPVIELEVLNTGDRPVQVGSHYPFLESNRALKFNRRVTYGYRLNIAAGTAVRFEPGESKQIQLVPFAGEQQFYGGSAMVQGSTKDLETLFDTMKADGFLFSEEG